MDNNSCVQSFNTGVPNLRAAKQEVSGGRASEASSVFTAAPHRSPYRLSSTSCQHYGELYNYFIIYYNAIIIEIRCTINVMCLNRPETIPRPLVRGITVFHKTSCWCQKRLGTAVLKDQRISRGRKNIRKVTWDHT